MKILGSDYDGTLNYGGIDDVKISAIQKWRKAGHKFGIVSGRGKDFLKELLQLFPELQLDFFAACNGGYITDENGAVIYEARCNEVPLTELVANLFALGCTFAHVAGKQYMCVVEREENSPSYVCKDSVCLLDEITFVDYFNQVSTVLPSVEDASMVVEKIKKKYAKWLNPLQNGRCIDIVPVGVNKAQGIYRIMEFYGCAYEDVITVGDNINDIDMIREFRSYAMKNGVEQVQKLANETVSDITEVLEREL